jgi:hypothetical protein
VLSGRGLLDGRATRSEESYQVWCVYLSVNKGPHREALSPLGLSNYEKNVNKTCVDNTEYLLITERNSKFGVDT